MNAKELIEILKQLPEDTQIVSTFWEDAPNVLGIFKYHNKPKAVILCNSVLYDMVSVADSKQDGYLITNF